MAMGSGMGAIGRGAYNIGQSAWNKTKIWGSALGMGFEYGFNYWGEKSAGYLSNNLDTRQLLDNLSRDSGIAAVGCALSGFEPVAIVFGGIAASAKGIEIGFFSKEPTRDTRREVIKIGVGSKISDPYNLFTDELIEQIWRFIP